MSLTLYVGPNDNLLTLVGLQDEAASSYLNAATVVVTVVDADGAEISGETWPLALAYVASSNGDYRATLTDTLSASLSSGVDLVARITANAGDGLNGYWAIPILTATRTS